MTWRARLALLLAAGCTAAPPEQHETTAEVTAAEPAAAPERNERGAIDVEEFLAGQRSGLSRNPAADSR